ncbi:hypothetical protein EXS70_01305 [Candidatus Peribacteria bacterium]|nr:hypothetical protein [Candidatus Peribacteria bacterium]
MRLKREHIIGVCLELFAIALANWQALGGVRTDEAKYLLNIPYPHPPLLRWVMSATEVMPFQEMFWRLLLASLLVQAMWLVWDMTHKFHLEDRIVVCAGWLFSSALLVQAGSIVLAPVTALEVVVLLWLWSRPEIAARNAALIGLFWLAAVFSGFQSVLFYPLVWSILRHTGLSRRKTALYVLAPIGLLLLWLLTNPLVLATMAIHSNDGAHIALGERLIGATRLWIVGGAGVISAVGTYGIVRSKDWALIGSFLLVTAYVTASVPYPFYAILFTPLFVAGTWKLFAGRHHPHAFPLLACFIFASATITWFVQPARLPAGDARAVMQAIESGTGTTAGAVLISGPFGHEWQYESRRNVMRYKPELVKDASAVVCLAKCAPMFKTKGWKNLTGLDVETWVKK